MQKERVIIIGSGPAGLTAALYTARAQLEPIVIVGKQLGGQVSITHDIENYPGFIEGVGGPELVDLMKKQSERFGARYEHNEVVEVDFTKGSPFYVKTHDNEYMADAVIVTAGASPKKLGVPGEESMTGLGVSYCGTCDGFFFRGKEIVVVGGGDSAIEEALFLTRFASKVEIVHRRDELRAGVHLQERAFANEKISFIWNSEIKEIRGEGAVSELLLHNRETGEEYVHPTQGCFIFIGHYPNSNFLGDQLAMDEQGYLLTDEMMRTNVPGVFAAGELQDPVYRQVATSVGQGCAAGMQAERWLSEQ